MKVTAVWGWTKEKVLRILPRERFARSVAVLAGGTALGQAIVVVASPVLTRLYSPDDFGVLAVYSSILGIISVIASLRYELAIPLPEKDEDAANLLALCLGIVGFMGLFMGIGTLLLGDKIAAWTNAPGLRPYLWLLPIGVVLVGAYNVFTYWAVRKQVFAQIARTKIHQGLSTGFTQIGLGLLRFGPLGLIVGHILGQSAGVITLSALLWRKNWHVIGKIHIPQIKVVANRYQRFPKLSAFPAFINALGLQLPIIALSILYGTQVTGWFSLVNKVLGAPLSLVMLATAQVTVGQAAERKRSLESMEDLFWRVIKQQSVLGLPLLLVAPLCPFVFPIIFGSEWKEAGIYSAVWLPSLIANFIASPTGGFLDVMERQEVFFLRETLRIVFLGAAVSWCYLLKMNKLHTISVLSVTMILFAFVYAALSLWVIRQKRKEVEL